MAMSEMKGSINMSKPRLCEILGVEVNERFRFKDFPDTEFEISPYGYINYFGTKREMDANFLCEMIKRPDWIIHKPKWTQQDIEDAKAIKRLFPGIETVTRRDDGRLYIHDFYEYTLNPDAFASLNCGESVELDEILSSEAET